MGLAQFFAGAARKRATVPRGVRVYAIGDIHGRDDLLEELLEKIEQELVIRSGVAPVV